MINSITTKEIKMIAENEIAKTDQEKILGQDGRDILNKYVSKVPSHITGPDRVSSLMDYCLEMPKEDRYKINKILNK